MNTHPTHTLRNGLVTGSVAMPAPRPYPQASPLRADLLADAEELRLTSQGHEQTALTAAVVGACIAWVGALYPQGAWTACLGVGGALAAVWQMRSARVAWSFALRMRRAVVAAGEGAVKRDG